MCPPRGRRNTAALGSGLQLPFSDGTLLSPSRGRSLGSPVVREPHFSSGPAWQGRRVSNLAPLIIWGKALRFWPQFTPLFGEDINTHLLGPLSDRLRTACSSGWRMAGGGRSERDPRGTTGASKSRNDPEKARPGTTAGVTSGFKTHHKVTAIRAVWSWHKDRPGEQWSRREEGLTPVGRWFLTGGQMQSARGGGLFTHGGAGPHSQPRRKKANSQSVEGPPVQEPKP